MKQNPKIWTDKKGNFHELSKMDDQYLYNTVKMIWNNVIGTHNPFGDVISWSFSEENYPNEYLIEFFCNGFAELVNRKDNGSYKKFIHHVMEYSFVDDKFSFYKNKSLKSFIKDEMDYLDRDWGNN